MQSGKIGVTTENIFPIIKKFLYSEHDIFLRELVSNAVDATQKLKTLSSMGEFNGSIENNTVSIAVDEDAKTITISDNGIGMTAEEVEKYINQIAFSGAEEFLDKYKDQANIIGHFGLGFYSSFMVAKDVELVTLSYKEGSEAVKWTCDGSPEYTMTPATRASHGTDIILHLADDSLEFASKSKISELLNKYCRFLPVPIAFGMKEEYKDGKMTETDEVNIVNTTSPLWTKSPSSVTAEEYSEFYHSLYPAGEDPLFNIHLNVDYPFTLTGILYFPKIKTNFDIQKNKIQLYSNQVFVTDTVDGIVPEFLTLLHGVIDSPDIPLNVSRSYLQGDPDVKKISSHITKKVADRLNEIFKNSREEFEQKWDDLKIFIQYGIVSEEKFADKAKDFVLLKNCDGKYFTLADYETVIKENQTDVNDDVIYLYTNDKIGQHSFIEAAKAKGYDVLNMSGNLDGHFIGWFENKNEKHRFVRVDSDVVDKLIKKNDNKAMSLSTAQQDILRPVFESQLANDDKVNYMVSFEPLDETSNPMFITQNEFMRRMKDMSQMGGQYAFYGQMPDSYNLVVNGNHPLVSQVLDQVEKVVGKDVAAIDEQVSSVAKQKDTFDAVIKDKKDEDLTSEEKEKRDEINKELETLRKEKTEKLRAEGEKNDLARQLIDLALLSNGMLKGEQLTSFIQRSVKMIEKK
ncbi:MAG: molecular chaperone HtpG [Rikenellaceae bacterium]